MRLALGTLIACAALPAAAQTPPLRPLPAPAQDSATVAQDVNVDGVVVGYGQDGNGSLHALRWQPGASVAEVLSLPAGVTYALASGVNKTGVAVGTCIDAAASHACEWSATGQAQELPGAAGSTNDQAVRVNDSGTVVGQTTVTAGDGSTQVHAALWLPGQPMLDLGTLPGGDFSQALDVGKHGEVVGVGSTTDPASGYASHAFLWTAAGGLEDLGTLPGDFMSAAVGVNAAGQIAGYSMGYDAGGNFQLRSFLWTRGGGMIDLGHASGSTMTQAVDVGDGGQVAGYFYDASWTQHAFVWTQAGGLQDLGTLTGGTMSTATAVNQYGTVVGQGNSSSSANGQAFIFDRQPAQSDTTPPVSLATFSPAPNAAGWNSSDVLVSLTATDSESGVREIRYQVNGASVQHAPGAQAQVALSGDGAWTVHHQAVDNAGNEEVLGAPLSLRIDATRPLLDAQLSGTALHGWYRSPVTVSFTASDALSGLAFVSPAVQLSSEGANQTVSGLARDVADNETSVAVGGISIDLTAPALSLTVSRSELWPPNHQMVAVLVSGQVSDQLSGVDGLRLGISSSQPDDADGDGSTTGDVNGQDGFQHPVVVTVTPDAQGRFSTWVQLRAERSGGEARVYTVGATVLDRAGNATRASAQVRVAQSSASKTRLRRR